MDMGLGHCPLALALPRYASLEMLVSLSTLVPTSAQWGWQ